MAPPTACGHCRHHKVRCSPECKYKPFFPPESGNYVIVAKIYKVEYLRDVLLTEVPSDQRATAFNNIIREARLRHEDPINGSIGKIDELEANLLLGLSDPAVGGLVVGDPVVVGGPVDLPSSPGQSAAEQ
ncbi:hypothetical protein L6452_41602 [Arctium lappa]|uniref:Uncharacterized protein n=1 Tax=Arctium lappa TaxID=4217 RepID=A0ACB8XQ40_ARCLA|nr:hypothetical protein L6452_41602 [Arctium lappa]